MSVEVEDHEDENVDAMKLVITSKSFVTTATLLYHLLLGEAAKS